MCDTVTQLSIYSVDRVKLTAMSVNVFSTQWHYRFNNNADIFSRFLNQQSYSVQFAPHSKRWMRYWILNI